MQLAVHWQDADSSSAKAVREVFPDAEIMICGGHAGRAHKKILELRQKIKKASQQMLHRYKDSYPDWASLPVNACVWVKATTVPPAGALLHPSFPEPTQISPRF